MHASAVVPASGMPKLNNDQYERMNPRHRLHLIVSAMLEGVSAGEGPKDKEGNTVAMISIDGTSYTAAKLSYDNSDQGWDDQLQQVLEHATERWVRAEEIYLQQTDILSYLALPVRLGPVSHPWTMLFLAAVHECAFRIGSQIKDVFDLARPAELSVQVAPMIQTPAHSAFPSGHSIESNALAAVLGALFHRDVEGQNEVGNTTDKIAARITLNRVIAGVHYPVDGEAGAPIGRLLGALALSRLSGQDNGARFHPVQAPSGEKIQPAQDETEDNVTIKGTTGPAVLTWLRDKVAAEINKT